MIKDEPSVASGTIAKSRKPLLLLGAILVVCLLVGIFFLYKASVQKKHPVIPAHLSVNQQSEYLAYKGDYNGSQKLLAAQIAKTSNKTVKAGLYLQAATIAINAKKYTDAKKYALSAESLQPTSNTAGVLGDIEAQMGDKAAAKKYYQLAISRLNKTAPDYSFNAQDYQERLKELER